MATQSNPELHEQPSVIKSLPKTPSKPPGTWTKEQYDTMQKKAHELGMHLITPYRRNLKNIRVGVIEPVV